MPWEPTSYPRPHHPSIEIEAAIQWLCRASETRRRALGEVAGGQVACGLHFQGRLLLRAYRLGEGAAWMKTTAAGRVERGRNFACHRTQAPTLGGVDGRDAVEQSTRVRMLRLRIELLAGRLFHDFAQVHDHHPLGEM